MEAQFATVEVRDAALYAVALGTPQEAETLLAKCALFQPSATAIKRMAQQMGQWLEAHEDEALAEIRDEEPIPDQTRVLCASLDGVNVLLSEPGKKKGRPNERPHEGTSRETPSPTCYKNAMVGSVSFYGEVPEGKASPERLASRYAARMPEDRERTFFARNGHRMDYARFREHGWPIGSGPVEAACKSVVKTRLCRSGMRWSRSGGQHILSLRTYVKSNRWDAIWTQYKRITRSRSPCNTT